MLLLSSAAVLFLSGCSQQDSPERLLVILDEEADFRTVLENLCGKIKKNKL